MPSGHALRRRAKSAPPFRPSPRGCARCQTARPRLSARPQAILKEEFSTSKASMNLDSDPGALAKKTVDTDFKDGLGSELQLAVSALENIKMEEQELNLKVG